MATINILQFMLIVFLVAMLFIHYWSLYNMVSAYIDIISIIDSVDKYETAVLICNSPTKINYVIFLSINITVFIWGWGQLSAVTSNQKEKSWHPQHCGIFIGW